MTTDDAGQGPVERHVRGHRDSFDARQAAWCQATGLRVSTASHRSALRWLPEWRLPDGFDHTGVYYWPRKRIHILLTEPYHSTERALLALHEMAVKKGGSYAFVVGRAGTGLWLPGACISLLVACEWADEFLGWFAADLPGAEVAPPNVELSGRRRRDAGPGPVKMYGVPPARAWWPAVGAPLERRVRRYRALSFDLHSIRAPATK